MKSKTLNEFLNNAMLQEAIAVDNSIDIQNARQNVPFTFLQYLKIRMRPNFNAVITNADNSVGAATVQSFDAEGKTQGPRSISTMNLDKNPISNAKVMSEREMGDFEHLLSASSGQDGLKLIAEKMYDAKTINDLAIYERFEDMYLQLLSTGKITLTASNNLDGLLTVIDYDVPASHKNEASVKWSTTGSAVPITDMKAIIKLAKAEGIIFDSIFMDDTALELMMNTDSFKELVLTTFGDGVSAKLVGLEQVNKIFKLVGLPKIVIIEDIVRVVNSSNQIVMANSWESTNVTFGVSSQQGEISTATPPKTLLAGKTDINFAVDNKTGIMNIIKTSADPMFQKQTGKVYALPVVPAIYRNYFLDINP